MIKKKQKIQDNRTANGAKDQSDTNTDSIQNQDTPSVDRKPDEPDTSTNGKLAQNGDTNDTSQNNEEGTQSKPKSILCILIIIGIIGIILGIILSNLFGPCVGICLAVFLCFCAIVFCYYAYKCLQKDNLSCTISWLVGLSLQFILIIVIGLFSNTYSGFSVTVQRICILNESTITLTSVLLFILSIFISILSGYIVYKKDEEKKQKQQDMTDEIKKMDNVLKKIYGKGNANG